MFLTFIECIISYVLARAAWDFIKRRAEARDEVPAVWIIKTSALLGAFLFLLSVFGIALLFLISPR